MHLQWITLGISLHQTILAKKGHGGVETYSTCFDNLAQQKGKKNQEGNKLARISIFSKDNNSFFYLPVYVGAFFRSDRISEHQKLVVFLIHTIHNVEVEHFSFKWRLNLLLLWICYVIVSAPPHIPLISHQLSLYQSTKISTVVDFSSLLWCHQQRLKN